LLRLLLVFASLSPTKVIARSPQPLVAGCNCTANNVMGQGDACLGKDAGASVCG